jgi:Abnormal spindle-like microcephaly-assoc'd, ASPM-SPD-2-Hydin
VTELTPDSLLTTTLPTAGNVAVRIRKQGSLSESFVFENRGVPDRWISSPLDTGVAIWHIDDTRNGNIYSPTSLQNGVALVQSDGLSNLEAGLNHGDANDLFDSAKPEFSDNTIPSARWYGGQLSFVSANVIGAALLPSAQVRFGQPANTIEVFSPSGGELFTVGSTATIRWKANISGNVKIELFKGGVFNSLIATNELNDRLFNWVVPSGLPFGSDYSIKVSSVTTPAVSDFSTGTFKIDDGFFPVNGLFPYGWTQLSKKFKWKVTEAKTFEGKYALVTENVGDGKKSGIAYSSNFKAGTVGFALKVSTEKNADFIRFFIDDVPQVLSITDTATRSSGEVDWRSYSFPVAAGNHTFKWIYQKDDAFKAGSDKVWLDGVFWPETTQEILVRDPAGTELTDGTGLITLPTTGLGNPVAQTVRVYNVGFADLFGMSVVVEGANSADFTIKPLEETAVRPGQNAGIDIVFNPSVLGLRQATIRILSNDTDESRFAINVRGTGVPAPFMKVYQPLTNRLKDNAKKVIGYGNVAVKSKGKTKTFTIRNEGEGDLTGLAITKNGKNKGAFKVGIIGATTLAPGASTTFTVTFKPSKKGNRVAAIHINSSNTKIGVFDIKLNGTGVKKKSSKKKDAPLAAKSSLSRSLVEAALGRSDASSVSGTTSLEVIDGKKYLALSVEKDGEITPNGVVEVSSNLIDWYSGVNHTTTILDNDEILKVRDNTPVTPEAKRYIRYK